jgi:Ca2+-binding RTX toxin-like protein
VDDASSGADSVTAGGSDQTLTGGAGRETFNGFNGGSTTFEDTAAAINGDTINNFLAGGDAIDITNISVTAPAFSFNPVQNGSSVTLNISDGTHSAAMTLNGSFNVADFRTGPDSGSGTSITYQVPKG